MTITTVVGSSGSGKTTFLDDVHESHDCVYIRQYHSVRPYIPVTKVPEFDYNQLPFWEIYEREGVAETIKLGGSMAGENTAGLSGGQRKLFLFELVYQRTRNQRNLLICLDEPFAGVTDDFVPWILERLQQMTLQHNILLVTNDHVKPLTDMSDNIITMSAVDRSIVTVNAMKKVDREQIIFALSLGEAYAYYASASELKFFWDTEVWKNSGVIGVMTYALCAFACFIPTFWNSAPDGAALVFIAIDMIGYFAIKPYLLALVDWRALVSEEAEALMHSSREQNKRWKSYLTLTMIFLISILQFALANLVLDGIDDFTYWVAMLFDSGSLTFPTIYLALYTNLSLEATDCLSSLPFMFLIFFSTTYSPGSGIPIVKELRYLFSRFYFWCMTPGVQDLMEGCPADRSLNVLYLALTGLLYLVILMVYTVAIGLWQKRNDTKKEKARNSMKEEELYRDLQMELFGPKQRCQLKLSSSRHTIKSSGTDDEKALDESERQSERLASFNTSYDDCGNLVFHV